MLLDAMHSKIDLLYLIKKRNAPKLTKCNSPLHHKNKYFFPVKYATCPNQPTHYSEWALSAEDVTGDVTPINSCHRINQLCS